MENLYCNCEKCYERIKKEMIKKEMIENAKSVNDGFDYMRNRYDARCYQIECTLRGLESRINKLEKFDSNDNDNDNYNHR